MDLENLNQLPDGLEKGRTGSNIMEQNGMRLNGTGFERFKVRIKWRNESCTAINKQADNSNRLVRHNITSRNVWDFGNQKFEMNALKQGCNGLEMSGWHGEGESCG